MAETPTTQQFSRRRFGFFFIFRIAPGFFVGFIPRRMGSFSADYDYQYNYQESYDRDNEMVIERIGEQEYMMLRRIGVPEIPVMM